MTRNRAARSGTHPREARITESASSSADLPRPDFNDGIEEDSSAQDIVKDTDATDTNAKDTDELDPDIDPEERQRSTPSTTATSYRQSCRG